jgi:hypothetical protein
MAYFKDAVSNSDYIASSDCMTVNSEKDVEASSLGLM